MLTSQNIFLKSSLPGAMVSVKYTSEWESKGNRTNYMVSVKRGDGPTAILLIHQDQLLRHCISDFYVG